LTMPSLVDATWLVFMAAADMDGIAQVFGQGRQSKVLVYF
jgi:hypothetical protein